MNSTVASIIRVLATCAAAGLAAAEASYPGQLWIPAVMAALAVYGIHGIPTSSQQLPSSNLSTSGNIEIHQHTSDPFQIESTAKHEPFTGE